MPVVQQLRVDVDQLAFQSGANVEPDAVADLVLLIFQLGLSSRSKRGESEEAATMRSEVFINCFSEFKCGRSGSRPAALNSSTGIGFSSSGRNSRPPLGRGHGRQSSALLVALLLSPRFLFPPPFPFAPGRHAHRPQDLAKRMRRDRRRPDLLERRGKLCVAWDRAFHLVSSGGARTVRGKLSSTLFATWSGAEQNCQNSCLGEQAELAHGIRARNFSPPRRAQK